MPIASTILKETGTVAAVLASIVLLGIAVGRLTSDEELAHSIDRLAVAFELHEGDLLPEIEVPVVFPQREKMRIPQENCELLVMFYSGRCAVCNDAWPAWNRIALSAGKNLDIKTVALSVLDEASTLQNIAIHEPRSKVGLFVRSAGTQAYKVYKLPMIIHIRNRRVVAVYRGPIDRGQEQTILQRLK